MLAEYSNEFSQQQQRAAGEGGQSSNQASGTSGSSSTYRHHDGAVLFGSANGDYRFRLKLFPSGKDEDCRGYLSLFLQIIKCPSAKLRFRVNFYIEAADGPRGCALNKNIVTINRGGIVTASKFFSTETLKSRLAKFLPEDILTVGVDLTVFGEQSSTEIEPDLDFLCANGGTPASGSALAGLNGINEDLKSRVDAYYSMGRELGHLLDTGDFSDFTLNVGRRAFKCHRSILSARSAFFQGMFRDQNNQECTSGEDSCPEQSRKSLEILAAADRFCLDRLKNLCENALMRDLSPTNVCERLRAADLYNASLLKWKILNLLQKHRNYIVDNACPYLAATVTRQVLSAEANGSMLSSGTNSIPSQHDPVPSKRSRMS
ncbi:unnamed protein product [Gongylonema pulchrum]|uniref:BTB domain-containing protein n=1 Tax=Gongylonema pulchrum TaxID=637853 RepID=A0A183DSK7_9BILA|nr:unnamed protein product [Gongylonema pulchrum]